MNYIEKLLHVIIMNLLYIIYDIENNTGIIRVGGPRDNFVY